MLRVKADFYRSVTTAVSEHPEGSATIKAIDYSLGRWQALTRYLGDLLAPNVKVLTVAGAGQTGVWEDVAGRTGDIKMVRAFRKNMVFPEAANSGAAKQQWIDQKDIDAWLIWNIWQVANPELAQVVEMDEPFRIYRDAGVVLTRKGTGVPRAREFVEFLSSPAGRAIFAKWGWDTP